MPLLPSQRFLKTHDLSPALFSLGITQNKYRRRSFERHPFLSAFQDKTASNFQTGPVRRSQLDGLLISKVPAGNVFI